MLCSALCPGGDGLNAERGHSKDLCKDVHYRGDEPCSAPGARGARSGCHRRWLPNTRVRKSQQGDSLLLPAAGDLRCSRKWVRPTGVMLLSHPRQDLVAALWQGVPETQLVGLQVLTPPGTWCDLVAGTLRQG